MPVHFSLLPSTAPGFDAALLVVPLASSPSLSPALTALDQSLGGIIGRAVERREFRGNRDEQYHFVGGPSGPQRVLLVGLGPAPLKPGAWRRAAAIGARFATKAGTGSVHIWADSATASEIEEAVVGAGAGAWDYPDLKTPPPEAERRAPLTQVTVVSSAADAATALDVGVALHEGYSLARRLGQMPGNVCTPDTFAEVGRDIAARHGMTLTVLGREEMTREGMGSFLCVAQGTPEDPKLVALEHKGGPAGQQPVVLVGKGLCFDTGGISIKPAPMGAMETIGRLKLPINVVGLVGSTTNMPSGTAVKPGDVVRASNGKTIEIINTDAEGRLVLADVLHYASRFNPSAVIDAATLTGAIVIGLGHTAVGVFGSDDALIAEVLAAGERAAEKGWQLPLWDEYKEQIKSDVADLRNTGGRAAGSITAALFLKEFTSFPWVHLDVAGTAYSQSDLGWIPRGPTGTPVGIFVHFVRGRVR
ncbi:MAG: leucyl aminopeptidase [Gemmatimonadaceae bacterium]|nr:leucyl aminopeptidase [Gemmatimonadaceae bacterium]